MSRNRALYADKRRRVTEINRYSPRDRFAVPILDWGEDRYLVSDD